MHLLWFLLILIKILAFTGKEEAEKIRHQEKKRARAAIFQGEQHRHPQTDPGPGP